MEHFFKILGNMKWENFKHYGCHSGMFQILQIVLTIRAENIFKIVTEKGGLANVSFTIKFTVFS